MTDPRPTEPGYLPNFKATQSAAPPRPLMMQQLQPPQGLGPIFFVEQTHIATAIVQNGDLTACQLLLYTPDRPFGYMLVMDAETARDIIGHIDRAAAQLEAAADAAATKLLNQLRADKGGAA